MREASRPSGSWDQYRLFVEWAIRYMARAGEKRMPNGHFCRGTYNTGGHTKEEVQKAFRDRYPDVPIPQSVFNNKVVPPLSKLWMVASSLNADGQGSKYWWDQEGGSRGNQGDPRPEAMAARPPAPAARDERRRPQAVSARTYLLAAVLGLIVLGIASMMRLTTWESDLAVF